MAAEWQEMGDEENQVVSTETHKAPASGSGCLTVGLFLLAGIWILGSTVIAQLLGWVIEQGMFEGSIPVADLRWLVTVGYAVAILLPVGLLAIFIKAPKNRAIYLSWALAGGFTLLMVLAHLVWITDSQLMAVAQAAGMLVFLLALEIYHRRNGHNHALFPRRGWRGTGTALLIVALLLLPWALWGALGSPLDAILSVVVALLFGACAAGMAATTFWSAQLTNTIPHRSSDDWLDGYSLALMLVIMVTGFGQNSIQWVLALSVPFVAWAVTLLRTPVGAEEEQQWNSPVWALVMAGAVLGPLLFLDADELMVVISSTPDDILGWAGKGASIAVVTGIFSSIGLALLRKQSGRFARLPASLNYLAVGAWVAVAALYFVIGQPGFYGERLFVILKDQADVSEAANIQDLAERRQFVYDALVSQADQSQAEIRNSLDQYRIAYRPYYLVNAMEVNGGPLLRAWLDNRPEVDRILDDPILRPLPNPLQSSQGSSTAPGGTQWNLEMIGADRVWEEGITGQGVVVGQSDSGVQGDHPEVAASYRGRTEGDAYNWYDPWYGSTQPTDIGGHGTHTLGTVLGENVGVAPGATWIGCVNLARNLGNPGYYLDCMQFMLAPFPMDGDALRDGQPARGANVLNNSWGCPDIEGCDPASLQPAVQALRAAGVFVVVSAGNAGYSGCGSVKDPLAIYDAVYSVGAVDSNGQLAGFSSLGPVTVDGSQRVKPDILAPGDGVLSAFPNNTYEIASGTSMAGPHIAGVVALMWSANPDLIGDIDTTQEILDRTASRYDGPYPSCVDGSTDPNNAAGYGIVDAYAAVQAALERGAQ
ncbi:MAG: S8 family serine peptidase [Chloroflexi bacterium]|nr:S8 family serine peptidase [Chloroflexota bacterium]